MPTLAYSLFILVVQFTQKDKEHNAWINFLIAISIPILGYLFSQIILPLWKYLGDKFRFNLHVFLIFIIVITLVFLFFLIRGTFIIINKKSKNFQKHHLIWKIPITIIFPLFGLIINNHGFPTSFFTEDNAGIFGNFNNIWFYILALANGILLCLPEFKNKRNRLFLFIGRNITFAYTLYFFLVFLPFLPLSVFAIIGIGSGFLMLAPLVLFIIHANELSKDVRHLKTWISKKLIITISVLGFLVIPTFITLSYLKDKHVLNETLAYLYSPDYSKKYDIDKKSLQKTLNVINGHKNYRNGQDMVMFSHKKPYLSSYFNWLVMDNLTLSDKKINFIERIFFGETSFELPPERMWKDHVEITHISSNSTYDKTQQAWKTWVDLEITNKNKHGGFAEYATTIDLPDGCWISDYYLYVGDKKEYGILAEKKAAMWIFSQIRNENKDPGILHYLTGNKVAFKVFPFSKNEVRKTGIEFLHKEPLQLTIDNHTINLGNQQAQNQFKNIETENIIYVSSQEKQALQKVKRKPYFHFLIDASTGKKSHATDFIERIEKVLNTHKPLVENAKVSFVNTYVNTTSLDENWEEQYKNQPFEGGFYLDRAIRQTLFDAYKNTSKTYPIMVVVTDSIQQAILEKDFADLKFTFPENNLFFNLDENGMLQEHSLIKNPTKQLSKTHRECMFCDTVLAYKLPNGSIAYLPNNNQPSIVLKKDIFDVTEKDIKEKNWLSALTMQGQWLSQILHPETSDKGWLNLVKYSFISKIMTPLTSYLVVENEAQKAMLKKKQKQVLSGNKSLDLGEDTQRMSEPHLLWLIVLFGIILWFRKRKKRQFIKQ